MFLFANALEQKDTQLAQKCYHITVKPEEMLSLLKFQADFDFLMKHFDEAVLKYEKLLENERLERDKAQWHLLLAYLRAYPKYQDRFKKLLNTVVNDKKFESHKKRSEIEQLQKELSRYEGFKN